MKNNSTSVKRKAKANPSTCKICGSPALYSYFGVISCASCRVFFRRHALNKEKYVKCNFNGRCEINIRTRNICSYCRLSKCFQQGMQVEMIRGSLTKKSIKSKENSMPNALVKFNQIQKFPTLSLLDRDRSLLNQNQWILLSNIIHSYQESKAFLLGEHVTREGYSFNSSIEINENIVRSFLISLYEIAGNYLRANDDINHLSTNDRSVLIHTAADNITCFGGVFLLDRTQIMSDDILWNYLQNFYGYTTMSYERWSVKFIEPDIIVFKLALALFALSTNSRTFQEDISNEYTNVNNILNIENKYVELTWKYFLYKYGYKQSIRKYLQLIQWFLSITAVMFYAHQTQTHVNDIETLVEETELALILDDVDKIT